MSEHRAIEAQRMLSAVVEDDGRFGLWLATGLILQCQLEGTSATDDGVLVAIVDHKRPSFFFWPAVQGFCSEEVRRSFVFAASRGAGAGRPS